ncbi:MAG: GNAT family N-acetyltransferase [Leptolyngbyaceae cyanobacterium MO_188.B28]|nr:GNAT family N-acetyltransferase [Leptolyngbyaceae cyanobacterium MO_188.B28]
MQRTYQEIGSAHPLSHLAETVEKHFSHDTPLWWVEPVDRPERQKPVWGIPRRIEPIGGLWMGNAIDQLEGDRHAHIFLLYVDPDHRRRGIATALMLHAQNWAQDRGDRKIGLQVFHKNVAALTLYEKIGYLPNAVLMTKRLDQRD